MTPKKNIIRKPVHTLPDGSPLDVSAFGPGFTPKEAAFVAWYTHPGTEAFLNAGRAAIRAGYKPDHAIAQGYLLRRKPRIIKAIEEALPPVENSLVEELWRINRLSETRMFFDITDFYRNVPCKRKIRINGAEYEYDSMDIEAIPLEEIPADKRLCIDAIELKGPQSKVFYKLPDRRIAYRQFLQTAFLLFPQFTEDRQMTDEAAEIKIKTGKGLKGMAAYLRGEY